MTRKYLLLGGSSDLVLDFIKNNDWREDDEIVAQYCHNSSKLEIVGKSLPCKLEAVQADFTSLDSTVKFAELLKEKEFIPTHILHATAVPIENKRFTELSWRDVDKQLMVQCQSIFTVLTAVIKKMAKNKQGKIILILSSYSINIPPKFLSNYIMAKYALMGFGKAIASEYAAKNIQVNMVSPSMMETKFLQDVHESVMMTSAQNNPLKRNASTKDVIGLIKYLFSDENTFITGANIPVTGGELF